MEWSSSEKQPTPKQPTCSKISYRRLTSGVFTLEGRAGHVRHLHKSTPTGERATSVANGSKIPSYGHGQGRAYRDSASSQERLKRAAGRHPREAQEDAVVCEHPELNLANPFFKATMILPLYIVYHTWLHMSL